MNYYTEQRKCLLHAEKQIVSLAVKQQQELLIDKLVYDYCKEFDLGSKTIHKIILSIVDNKPETLSYDSTTRTIFSKI